MKKGRKESDNGVCCCCVKTCSFFKSLQFLLTFLFLILISITTFLGMMPFLITILSIGHQQSNEIFENQYESLESFLDQKIKSIVTSTHILAEEWEEKRIVHTNTTLLDHTKLFTHVKNFENTFCSFIFATYADSLYDSTYVGYDKILSNGVETFRFWRQYHEMDLIVFYMYENGTIDYDNEWKRVVNFTGSIRPYYQINNTNGYFGDPYASASGGIQTYYALPIRDPDNEEEYVGVIKNNLSLEMVTQHLTEIYAGKGMVTIVEASGALVGTSSEETIPYQYGTSERVFIQNLGIGSINSVVNGIFGNEDDRETFLLTEKKMVTTAKYRAAAYPYNLDIGDKQLEWTILQFKEVSSIYLSIIISFPIVITFSILVAVVSTIGSFVLLYVFVSFPIRNLTKRMKKAQDMKLIESIKDNGNNFFVPSEIKKINSSFLFLVDKLVEYRKFLPSYIKEKEFNDGSDDQSDSDSIISKDGSISDMSDTSNTVSTLGMSENSFVQKTIKERTSVQIQTRNFGFVVVRFIMEEEEDNLFSKDNMFSRRKGRIIQENFTKQFHDFLKAVETASFLNRGQIISFNEKYVYIGFNTNIEQSLRNSYFIKSVEFCNSLRKELKNKPFSFAIGISSSCVHDSVVTFGSDDNRIRKVIGRVENEAKMLSDMAEETQILATLECLSNVPMCYIFKPNHVIYVPEGYVLNICEFVEIVEKARDREWMYVYENAEVVDSKRRDLGLFGELLDQHFVATSDESDESDGEKDDDDDVQKGGKGDKKKGMTQIISDSKNMMFKRMNSLMKSKNALSFSELVKELVGDFKQSLISRGERLNYNYVIII